jgi:hypothetical protein
MNLGSAGGGFLTSPAMVVQSAENGYNTVIIAVGEDGNLYLNWQNASSDRWSGWINLSSADGGFERYIVIKGQVTAGGSGLSGVTVV